jgi:hypothetical protein
MAPTDFVCSWRRHAATNKLSLVRRSATALEGRRTSRKAVVRRGRPSYVAEGRLRRHASTDKLSLVSATQSSFDKKRATLPAKERGREPFAKESRSCFFAPAQVGFGGARFYVVWQSLAYFPGGIAIAQKKHGGRAAAFEKPFQEHSTQKFAKIQQRKCECSLLASTARCE